MTAPDQRSDGVALLACNADRQVVGANVAAERLLALSGAEMRGRPIESLAPEPARKKLAAQIAALVHRSPGTWAEIEVAHKNEPGGLLRLEVSCRPRAGAEGHLIALRRPLGQTDTAPLLTEREREVLGRVAAGGTGAKIAEDLFLSSTTVERHVANALRRLGAKNRAHGIAIALRTGELHPPGGLPPQRWAADDRALDALLVQTLEGLEDPTVVLDVDGNVIVANEAWRAFGDANGRPGVRREANYLAVCDAATGCDEAQQTAWGIRELLDGRSQSFSMEYRCDSPDTPRWFEVRAVRYHGGTTNPAVFVRHRDLTAQRRAETDARLGQSVVDGMDVATVVYAPDGTITAWLACAEAMMGWTAEDAIGRVVWDLFMPRRDRALGEAIVEDARRNGRWSGELQLERHDGTTFQADVRIRTLLDADGLVEAIIGVVVDIDEHHRVLRAASEAAAQLQAFSSTSRDGWISGDATGRITQINTATEELLGWNTEELVGRPIDEITAFPSPLRPLTRPTRNSGPRQVHEELLLASDGRQVLIEYTTSRFSTGEGLEQWAIVFRPASQPGPDAPPTLEPANDRTADRGRPQPH